MRGDDSGSALVVAIAIAVIGIALSTIVVSQAIVVMQDASRDRLRTVEIHAAEAALDATLKSLESTTPCDGTMTVGDGVTGVTRGYSDRIQRRLRTVCCATRARSPVYPRRPS